MNLETNSKPSKMMGEIIDEAINDFKQNNLKSPYEEDSKENLLREVTFSSLENSSSLVNSISANLIFEKNKSAEDSFMAKKMKMHNQDFSM